MNMEMNIFIPQSMPTMIELREIADVKRQIITPGTSTPIIGIVQDGMVGSYNITRPSVRVDWHDAMNIVSYTAIEDFSTFQKKEMTGSEVFSMIIPSRINTTEKGIVVENGELVKGTLHSKNLAAKAGNSLIHLVWDEYGMEKTKTFIDDVQRLINNFNLYHSATCGIGDIEVSPETAQKMHTWYETESLEVKYMITEMENNPDLQDPDIFETTIYQKLDTIRDKVSKLLMQNLSPNNNFQTLISSGAKGKAHNLGQMGGYVGQQGVMGKRIQKKVNGRALPYFHQHDDSALARGFVAQSFVEGVKLSGFVFHNMSAREGLIDTAIKSVVPETRIIVLEDGQVKMTEIGPWIDQQLERAETSQIEVDPNHGQETLNLTQSVLIPSTDAEGNLAWREMTAITRHDPTQQLFRIETQSGRSVTVTDSKSLLIHRQGQLVPVLTPEVVLGDQVPVNYSLPTVEGEATHYLLQNAPERYSLATDEKLSLQCETMLEKAEEQDAFAFGATYQGLYTEFTPRGVQYRRLSDREVTLNDIFLDPITKITPVDPSQYPKVYDVTVPETLNFGLANGLQVRDTAESGYVQRKLIKALEDASIKYDGTVRNANNTIVQFIYGDNGINTTKQSKHTLELISMDNQEVKNKLCFTDAELKKTDWSAKENEAYYQQLLDFRTRLREIQFKIGFNYTILNQDFKLPFNLMRIIANQRVKKYPKSTPLKASYVVKKLEEVLSYEQTKLTTLTPAQQKETQSFKYRDEMAAKTLMKFVLHEYLGPKRCLFEYQISQEQFEAMVQEVIDSFNRAVIQPGEMVGIIAAQSCGEPVTQLTLNSVDWEEKVTIKQNNCQMTLPIGEWIDTYMQEAGTTSMGDKPDQEMGEVYYQPVNGFEIQTVDEQGQVFWAPIQAMTKHLPQNLDGTDTLVQITTASGRSITATKAKSFLQVSEGQVSEIRGDEVFMGMKIPSLTSGTPVLGQVDADPVIEIKEVCPTHRYVYDLTVEPTKNFFLANGLACRDTFHSAGIAAMGTSNLGVDRIKELLSLTKNPKEPVMMIYMDEENKKNLAMVNKIAYHIKYTTIGDLAKKLEIFYDPNPFKKGGFMDQDQAHNIFYSHNTSKNSCQPEIATLPWLMRISLDREKMMNKEVTMLDIKSKFCSQWERRYSDLKGVRKEERQLLEKITQCAVLSNHDNSKNPVLHIRLDVNDFNLSTLINFQEIVINRFRLKGIAEIEDIRRINADERMLEFNPKTGAVDKNSQHVIYTAGINMVDIRYVNGIDLSRTICNDVVQVYEHFGVEAARTVLLKEIRAVFDAAGKEINYQHLSILIDTMTNNGTLTSINRHGLNRLDTDPLARASFEKTIDQLLSAAVFGERDHMRSVSSRIMAGMVIKGGTGLCDLVLDTDLLENSEYLENLDQKYHKTFQEISTDAVMDDLLNQEGDGGFMPM